MEREELQGVYFFFLHLFKKDGKVRKKGYEGLDFILSLNRFSRLQNRVLVMIKTLKKNKIFFMIIIP